MCVNTVVIVVNFTDKATVLQSFPSNIELERKSLSFSFSDYRGERTAESSVWYLEGSAALLQKFRSFICRARSDGRNKPHQNLKGLKQQRSISCSLFQPTVDQQRSLSGSTVVLSLGARSIKQPPSGTLLVKVAEREKATVGSSVCISLWLGSSTSQS